MLTSFLPEKKDVCFTFWIAEPSSKLTWLWEELIYSLLYF